MDQPRREEGLRDLPSPPRVGSLFSGIGGLDLGLSRAGFGHAFFCESDPYRRAVLAHHWPGTVCFTDVREVARGGQRDIAIDLLCGGFPCQDLSVAGRRRGLAGERSGLFFEFARVADALLADGGWLLIENVPGLLSSHAGRDFAVLLATLATLGFHDLAWRVLDSRYFGVPQRRRRVFVLARRARGRSAATVLLEPESGGGDSEACRKEGARASLLAEAGAVQSLDRRGGGADDNEAQAGHLVAGTLAASLTRGSASGDGVSRPGRRQEDDENLVGVLGVGSSSTRLNFDGSYIAHTLRAEGFDASEDGTGRGTPLVCHPEGPEREGRKRTGAGGDAAASGGGRESPGGGAEADADRVRAPAGVPGRMDGDPIAATITRNYGKQVDSSDRGGGPPNLIGGGATGGGDFCAFDPRPDGRRYAACGDAVTVNVSEWIGQRLIQEVASSA